MPFQITQAPDGRGLVDLDRDHPFASPSHAKHAIEVAKRAENNWSNHDDK